jgi:hypothetical protein
MAKKTKKNPKKHNPTDINLLAREVVEAAIGEPLTHKSKSRRKTKKRKK